jgi:predicted outer membrane repeat protein
MRFRTTLMFSTLVLALASPAQAGIRYVNASLNSGANDGTSWADAFQGSNGLQAALAVALAGDQIWVAQGSYEPTPGTDRAVSFVLRNGVEIYGGFTGGETSLGQRDFAVHVTTLAGDLNGDDGSGQFLDNSYHVLVATDTDASAILDGCSVRGGYANRSSTGYQDRGGGILCVGGAGPTLRNCILIQNFGYAQGGAGNIERSSPTFVDCRFEWNNGTFGAGILVVWDSNPTFLRCKFIGNTSGGHGGALYIESNSNAQVTNCVFWNNTALLEGGGAIYVANSHPLISQCIVAGNHCGVNSAAGILASPPVALTNDIIYFNDVTGGGQSFLNNVTGGMCAFCCVQGISPGAGNIQADPLFVNLAAGDLHLSQFSPCADAGNNGSIPAGITTDLDGNPRLSDDPAVPDTGQGNAPIVDIGAYEIPNTLYSPFCAGDGSLATACPCGNTGAAGRGCLNSDVSSSGALLTVTGTASPDTVVLTSSAMLPTSSCVFLQGNLQNPAGTFFGDGVRCVAGSLKRLYVKSATLGTASAPGLGDPSISARSAALGDPIAPGTQRYYQVYYRDSDLGFCPAPQGNSWNVSSGVILNW